MHVVQKMKKRIRLTEKELAIGTWLYVKMMIQRDNLYHRDYIPNLKDEYLSAHNRCDLWINNCILCDKYLLVDYCSGCPLVICNPMRSCLYQKARGYKLSYMTYHVETAISHKYCLKTRLKACDKIIEAIEKKTFQMIMVITIMIMTKIFGLLD